MLTMDVDQTSARLQTCTATATTVSKHAQATVTAVPRIPNPPGWFRPVAADLKAAQDHAKDWLRRLCPAINGGMLRGLGNFNDAFQAATGGILDVLDSVDGGDALTAGQRTQVESALSDLTAALTSREQAVTALLADVKTYFTTIDGDQDKLQADLGIVSAQFVDSGKWIEQLDTVFSASFLDGNVLGPCTLIVNINMDVTMRLGQTGADPTFNTLVIAKAILENQIGNFTEAQQALGDILDTWTTYRLKVDAVVSDLKDASNDDQYLAILTQLDLKTAQRQWQQLADFTSAGANPINQNDTTSLQEANHGITARN
jgi:hypothetical protein